MVWAQVAMAATNVIEGYSKAKSARKLAEAEYSLSKGRQQREEYMRATSNMNAMADANLARYLQGKQNKAVMDNMEDQLHQEAFNASRQLESMADSKFESRLAAASAIGSIAASASFAGVGGSSIDQLVGAERVRQARIDNSADRQIKDTELVRNLNQTAIIDNGYNSLDNSIILADNLDYTPQDLVIDNSWQHKYGKFDLILGTGKAGQDAISGFTGNMNNVGMNLGGSGKDMLAGFMGGKGSTGKSNQGLGGKKGATRL